MAQDSSFKTDALAQQGTNQTGRIYAQSAGNAAEMIASAPAQMFDQMRAQQEHDQRMQEGNLEIAAATLEHQTLLRRYELYDREQAIMQMRAATQGAMAQVRQQEAAADAAQQQAKDLARAAEPEQRAQQNPYAVYEKSGDVYERQGGKEVKLDRTRGQRILEAQKRTREGIDARDQSYAWDKKSKRDAMQHRGVVEEVISELSGGDSWAVGGQMKPQVEAVLGQIKQAWGTSDKGVIDALSYLVGPKMRQLEEASRPASPREAAIEVLGDAMAQPQVLRDYLRGKKKLK